MSEVKNSIYKSLAAFQQECPTIHKDTKGYGYTYATLPTIFEVINPILAKNNLGFTQLIQGQSIKSILFHTETGETLESVTDIPQDVTLKGMNDYQVLGSAITYIRRYALSAMLGVVTDKDTDASGEQTKKATQKAKPNLVPDTNAWSKAVEYLSGGGDLARIKAKYTLTADNETELLKEVTDKAEMI
jgi:hypothetical protein